MMTSLYFNHPIEAGMDPRMEALEEKLHGRGFGVYWYIREKMCFFTGNRCRLEQLKPFATKYITFKLMQQVVLESGLFEIEDGIVVPMKLECELRSGKEQNTLEEMGKNTQKKRKTGAKNNKKTKKNEEISAKSEKKTKKIEKKQSKNDEKPMKNDEKTAEISEKTSEITEKTAENASEKQENRRIKEEKGCEKSTETIDNKETKANLCTKSNTNTSTIYIKRKKEREKDIITTEEEKKEEAAVRPWRKYVENLGLDSQWMEIACMKSGFGAVLRRHFALAKELFCQHIIAFGKGSKLLTQEEVTGYFVCFVTHPVTSKRLLRKLLELEQATATSPDSPYRHEQLTDGHRTYNGRRIPDEAPPRPDDHSLWNDRLKRWEPEYG